MTPFCRCGCGRHVKRAGNKYASVACVPLAARAMGGRNSRARFTLNRKARLFGGLLQRLDGLGKPTRGDLVSLFDAAYTRGWDNGYHASEAKWVRRKRTAA